MRAGCGVRVGDGHGPRKLLIESGSASGVSLIDAAVGRTERRSWVTPRAVPVSLQAIVERFHAHQTATSDQRVYAGLLDGLGDLPDPSLAAETARLADARSLLGELSALDRSTLSFDDALDADLIEPSRCPGDIHLSSLTFNGKVTSVQTPPLSAVRCS